jgi:hypothetical protein
VTPTLASKKQAPAKSRSSIPTTRPRSRKRPQDKADLSASDRRSVESYERLVNEHEEKLDAYKRDPEAFDNKGILEKPPSDELRE